jgi:uroporphyrin-3 C-methyltransferase
MTENNKQERHSDDAIEATSTATNQAESHPDQSKKQPTQTTTTKLFVSVSFGLSAIAIATSGWLYFQSTQSTVNQDIEKVVIQQANTDKKINTSMLNQSQLNQLMEQVKQSEQTIQTQKNQLLAHQSQQSVKLLSLESKLNRLSSTTKEDWKLAEAEYLIRLANQRLLLESDNIGAATLLSNADDILNELEDPIVFTTRKALAKDIQALKSISPFDLEGAYLKLNALYDSVQALPQREPSKEWQANTTAKPTTSTTNQLTSALESFWQSLRSLVVINYNHKPIKALLPPAEYQELITGLQLQLEIAQVALIKGEPVIYQTALSRVANATTAHFETQSNHVISFLASLTTLQQLNPSPDLPLPRESLIAMKSLMKEWTNRGDNLPITTATSTTEQSPEKEENLDAPQTDSGDDL